MPDLPEFTKKPKKTVAPLLVKYNSMKSGKVAKTLATREYADMLAEMCLECLRSLKTDSIRVPCISQIQGKTYHVYRKSSTSDGKSVTRTTRPINSELFVDDEQILIPLLGHFKDAEYETVSEQTITSLVYTIAMSFCGANDLRKSGDKKTPGTFFEFLVAHLVARQFGVLPRRKIKVPSVEGENCELPTDLIFELGKGMVKFHVPVKLSTRERSIQAWAHQRVLAGLWGPSAFKGLLVVLTETKLALETLKVTEILLPLQWAVYQNYIAVLDRVYYLDMPAKYLALATGSPRIDVKPLGAFFKEKKSLLER